MDEIKKIKYVLEVGDIEYRINCLPLPYSFVRHLATQKITTTEESEKLTAQIIELTQAEMSFNGSPIEYTAMPWVAVQQWITELITNAQVQVKIRAEREKN